MTFKYKIISVETEEEFLKQINYFGSKGWRVVRAWGEESYNALLELQG